MTDTIAGKLLVAMPGIGDPRFERTVILMCAHDEEHAMGLVINKLRDEISLSDVLGHLGVTPNETIAARAVLDGGPVRPERGFVLHSEDFTGAEGATQDVAPGIRLTATRDVLEAIGGDKAPEKFVLALGCSSWGAGQLEDELRQAAWLLVDTDNSIVFDDQLDDKWERSIRSLGLEPSQLSSAAGSA